jgi:hypothetical protein
MVRALILYTNGTIEVKNMVDYGDYEKAVGGTLTILPMKGGYKKPGTTLTTTSKLMCYANDDWLGTPDIAPNHYTTLLSLLGVEFDDSVIMLGNIVVHNQNADGEERDVDAFVIHLFEEYNECTDEDSFYQAFLQAQEHL